MPPISAASASTRSARRAAQNTWKPSAASCRAVAAPIPLLAPVTTAVRVSMGPILPGRRWAGDGSRPGAATGDASR